MYTCVLEVAEAEGFVPLLGGLDYRASPDWASKLGITPDGLVEYQQRSIAFLREVARPFEGRVPEVLFAGITGPRGAPTDATTRSPPRRRRRTTASSSGRWRMQGWTS